MSMPRTVLERWGNTISAAIEQVGLPPISGGIELLDGRTAFDAIMPDSPFAQSIAAQLGVSHVRVILRVEVPPKEQRQERAFMFVGGIPCVWANDGG